MIINFLSYNLQTYVVYVYTGHGLESVLCWLAVCAHNALSGTLLVAK